MNVCVRWLVDRRAGEKKGRSFQFGWLGLTKWFSVDFE